MADETENVTNDETNTNENTTGEKPGNTAKEKVFTQKEVDKIVQDRLNREKLTHKNEKDTIESEKTSLKETSDKYEAKLKELLAPELEGIDESYKELVEKLPLLEQVEFINKLNSKNKTNPDKKFINKTNKSVTDNKGAVVSVEPIGRIF